MSFQDSFKDFWREWLNYSGTTSRKEFWKIILMWIIIIGLFWGIIIFKQIPINFTKLSILMTVGSFIFWFPGCSLVNRRLNDTGLNPRITAGLIWAWILLPWLYYILPFLTYLDSIVTIAIFILCIFPTNFFLK